MIYIILSLLAFIGKSILFKKFIGIYNRSTLHKLIYAAFIILITQSIFELSLYYYAHSPYSIMAYWLLIGFYIGLFYAVSLSPLIALALNNISFSNGLWFAVLCINVAITYLLLFSRIIIADVAFIETTQSLTRVEGPYYFIFQIVVLACVLSTFIIFWKNSYAKNYFIRIRSRNLCLTFIPCFLFSFSLIAAMAIDIPVNAVGILAFILLIYLAAIVHNIQPVKQPDYMVFVPFTKKHKMLMSTLNQLVYMEPGINKETLKEQLINYYLSQSGLTQKEVSQLLNVSEATLSRRKKAHH